jgi:hypothetical protein
MNKIITSFILTILVCSIGYSGPKSGPNAPGQEVKPNVVNVSTLPPAKYNNMPQETKIGASPFKPWDFTPSIHNTPAQMDMSAVMTPIVCLKSWAGPNQNGWVPADADIAVGPYHVMVVTNEQYHIYDRNTNLNLMTTNTFQNFFNRPGKSVFDPKIAYDPWRGRWIMLVLEQEGTSSYYWVAASQTNNPTGSWWYWKLNAHVDGSTVTTNWADYPGLGFTSLSGSIDSGAVVITSNQYSQTNVFQYAKIRCLNVKQLYTGSTVYWYDFWNMSDENSDKTFTIKPCQNWFTTSSAADYLVNTKAGGGNVITTWILYNPHRVAGTPTLTRTATISTTAYSVPPVCPTPTSGTNLAAGDCRTQDPIFSAGLNASSVQKGYVYVAIPTKYNWGSGDNCNVFYMKINVTDNVMEFQQSYGSSGYWYMYPKVAPKYKSPFFCDTVGMSFNRGSSTTYLSARVVGIDRVAGFGSSASVYDGTANYGSGSLRNGDYNGICIDPNQTGRLWSVAMYSKTGGWGTGIGYLDWTTGSVGVIGNNGLIPSSYKLLQNYPNPFNPATAITFAIPKSGFVKLVVYDLTGKEIKVLVNENKEAGTYNVTFDASNLPSGAYFYKITANDFSQTKKMILNK